MAVHKRGGDDCEVAGRTVVEVKSEERRVKNPCVWIVVHRRELVEQIVETLEASLNVKCEMLNATHNVKCEMLNVKRGKPLDSSLFTFHLINI